MRLERMMGLAVLLALAACGPRARSEAAPAGEASGGSAGGEPAAAASPEELDGRYRENARHLVRDTVWDSPLRALSTQGLETLRRYSENRGNPESYLTLEVVSPDWIIDRHRATGAVTGRLLGAVTLARFPDGRCLQYGTSLRQEYVGGDFADAMTTTGTGGGVGVPCETIDAVVASRPDVAR
jgi:hypothetical protein